MKVVLGCACLFLAVSSALAQQSSNPVTDSVKLIMQRQAKNLPAAVDEMPADKFSFKPTPQQEPFAHIAVHVTETNNLLCSKAADVPAPKVDEAKDTDPKDKLVSAVKDSYSFCSDALGKMDDSKLGDSVELFGGRQFPRAMAALGLASGWADHYAAAAMYLRLNNILPPSAQPKK